MGYSGISYNGGASGLQIQQWSGTVDGDAMRNLSGAPVTLVPVASFNIQKNYQIFGWQFFGGWATTPSSQPIELTFDVAIYPIAQFNWNAAGNYLISGSIGVNIPTYLREYYIENNLNGGPFANLCLKCVVNTPGADYSDINWRIYYIENDIL